MSRAICVTGMHRSGTSFVARAVDALGVDFGRPGLLMPPGPDNRAGYWENRLVKELDDDLLAHLGGAWDSPPVLAGGWEHDPRLEEFVTRAAEVLDASFGARETRTPVVGWKDPRLSLLLPFWRRVVPIDATVVVVRHPAEVCSSLQRRNNMDAAQASLLWLRYLLAALDNDPDRHLVVDHRALFEAPAETLARIAAHLSLPAPDGSTLAEVARHLDPSLRHHVATEAAPAQETTDPVVRMADAVWDGGACSVDALDPLTREAIRDGWLRPPVEGEALARERARNVDLTALLRRRTQERITSLAAELAATADADDLDGCEPASEAPSAGHGDG